MASSGSLLAVLATLALLLFPSAAALSSTGTAALSPDFHAETCPQLDGIVRAAVQAALTREIAIAAGLVRIYFHDCFPQGCDASILLNSTSGRETALGPSRFRMIGRSGGQPARMQFPQTVRDVSV